MYPYQQPYHGKVSSMDEDFYFGNAPLIPWSKISIWKYVKYKIAEPPAATLYSFFTIDQFTTILLVTFVFDIWSQCAMKKITNPEVYNTLSWNESVIHGISSCFIPHPIQEWDEQKGTVQMHYHRKKLVWREMMASIMLNFTISLLLLSPLIILGTYHITRFPFPL